MTEETTNTEGAKPAAEHATVEFTAPLIENATIPGGAEDTVSSSQDTVTSSNDGGAEDTISGGDDTLEGGENKDETKKKSAWYMKEIGKQREEKQKERQRAIDAEAKAAKLEAELEAARKGETQDTSPLVVDTAKLVEERARQIVAAKQHAELGNAIYDNGIKDLGKSFDESVKALGYMGALYNADETPTPLMEAIAEMPEAHKIIHELAKDPENTERILSLSPVRQAVEMTKLQQSLQPQKTVKQTSNAPAPIKPLNGTGKSDLAIDDPKLSRDEYSRRRRESRNAKYK